MFKFCFQTNLEVNEEVVCNPRPIERELSSYHGEGTCVCKSFLGTCIHKTESKQTSKEATAGELRIISIYLAGRELSSKGVKIVKLCFLIICKDTSLVNWIAMSIMI